MNGHSLDRMKDVSSAAKMLNELKDQSDASAPGVSVTSSSSTAAAAAVGTTQLVLVLSRPAEGSLGNEGIAALHGQHAGTKQLPVELHKCKCM